MVNTLDTRFRPFEVKRKVRESATITSFYLSPVNPGDWRPFDAGQFLTIQIPDPNEGEPLVRNYTVSSAPSEAGVYRITVKREAALTPDMANGIASCWLHDTVEEGTVINVDRPRGAFKLDKASQRPVILLSGGVGITPTISMLKVLVKEGDRPVWFVHACDGAAAHALREEVRELAERRSNVNVHYCYRFPTDEDAKAALFHSTGFITRETMQSLLPLDDYEVYMCGPPPFMQAMYDLLLSLGLEKSKIAYEFFGPASLLSPSRPKKEADPRLDAALVSPEAESTGIEIVLGKSNARFGWDSASESILSFLESQGIEPAFSCRAGVCGSCVQGLISGDVEYVQEPLDAVPAGRILLCCSKPISSVVLDL
ncbi:2Fe-2S iron-sulfur cluster-binding protein [Rhizobium leguminosarum]|uniref:2Fe-2S iron-sulfur cluster-binding protein n=1 Tax=Rhizobium leguminosarum TaxID=384 RepID=UPI001F19F577|nr:2Fe-2S iron-sulfur cluster-binding protein [Rhizobium leguminosarum]UIJ82202.1 FAD-binding oxidoreductase [Rhizobium leguminosarum]